MVEKDEEEITSQEKDELEETESAIKRMKLKKATGIDGIPVRLKNLRENC